MSKVFVTGHKSPDTDSIAAALSYSYLKRQLGMDAVGIRAGEVNKETQFALDYFGLEAPELVTNLRRANPEEEKQKVILVDHNESKQTIDGMDDAEVIEIVDHHRMGDFESADPIFILIRPVGCVNTVIYGLYKSHQVKPSKEIAGIMASAIISDTVLFRSPTTTEEDKQAVKELSEIAGIDYNAYGMEMLKAGADISDYPASKLAQNDTKEFSAGGKTFTIGQISVMDLTPINAKKADILKELEMIKEKHGYDASYLMVTNVLTEDTFLWFTAGAAEIAEKAFSSKVEDEAVYLPKVMSRKKQVAPPLLAVYGE